MIAQHLSTLLSTLPPKVELLAVSKFHSTADIAEAYRAGQRIFGESRVQELVAKEAELRDCCPAIQWHQIGVLQRNKVKYIVPFVDMIHSVSSTSLIDEIERQAGRVGRSINILLQVHIAQEETKSGFAPGEIANVAMHASGGSYPHLRLCGLMGMATQTDDEVVIRAEFAGLKSLFDTIKLKYFACEDSFRTLSMGMSQDYLLAIDEGATLVRIGSSIFGER